MSGIVWIASYPRSGNTWFRAFLSNLQSAGPEPVSIYRLDAESFASREVFDRTIGWRTSELTPAEVDALRLPVQAAIARENTITLAKTHDIFRDPRDGRANISAAATRCAVYLVRNPLDVAVSIAHRWHVDYDEAVRFLNDPHAALEAAGHHPTLPQPLGDWSAHVRSWAEADGVRVLTVRYEDMLERATETFGAACRFAGLPSEPERVARAIARSTFASLQNEEREKWAGALPADRMFFRAGRQGSWREALHARHVAAIVERHRDTMVRFGYVSPEGIPCG